VTRSMRLLSATLLVLLLLPATAFASGRDVLLDCTDDEVLSKTYTQDEYKSALKQLPTDADEYGACRDVIRRAMLDAAAGGGDRQSGGGGGGAPGPAGGGGLSSLGYSGTGPDVREGGGGDPLAAATDEERRAVEDATRAGGAAVRVGDDTVRPGDRRAPGVAAAGRIPTPLTVLLVLLVVAAIALGATRVRSLVLRRRLA
jgi:hypothetical protein